MSTIPHIYTLTGNLLAERTLEFSSWEVGKTQRATRESFNTRGKGVNVSNMLARLGTDSTALIFTGGASGAESEAWLHQRGINFKSFPTQAASRTGTVIWSDEQAETTFLGPNIAPDPKALEACVQFIRELPDNQVLALCGSFPGWDEDSFASLRTEIERWTQRGQLYADVYGPPLHGIVDYPVELIKINRQEFDGFYSVDEREQPVPQRLRQASDKWTVKNWVISNGPASVWVQAAGHDPIELIPPKIKEVSPTGSGDVLFATMLHEIITRNASLVGAATSALPYASANAAHPGVADFELPIGS